MAPGLVVATKDVVKFIHISCAYVHIFLLVTCSGVELLGRRLWFFLTQEEDTHVLSNITTYFPVTVHEHGTILHTTSHHIFISPWSRQPASLYPYGGNGDIALWRLYALCHSEGCSAPSLVFTDLWIFFMLKLFRSRTYFSFGLSAFK